MRARLAFAAVRPALAAASAAWVALAACGQPGSAPTETPPAVESDAADAAADGEMPDAAAVDAVFFDSKNDLLTDTLGADVHKPLDVDPSIGLWTAIPIPGASNVSLHGVWSDGSTRVLTAGSNGTILGWNGLGWSVLSAGKFPTLSAVAGSPGAKVAYAVGMAGTIVQSAGKGGDIGAVWAIPGGCSAPSDCDDKDACTVDICDGGVCQHSVSGAAGCCGGNAFADSFDSGLGKWSVTDAYAGSANSGGIVWHAAGVYGTDGSLRAASPPNAAYFGRIDSPCADDPAKMCATYDNGKTVGASMTSQEFAVPAAKSASLTFQLFLDVQSDFYDALQVSVIAANGSKKTLANKQSNWPSGSTNGKFIAVSLNVSEFTGQKIKLQFDFNTYSNADNAGQGVFIDDLLVTTTCAGGSNSGKGLTDKTLFGAWAFSESDAWAVGDGGTVAHWDGSTWGLQSGGDAVGDLSGMAAIPGTGVLAVGDKGALGTVSQNGLKAIASGTGGKLLSVAAQTSSSGGWNACAVGSGGLTLDGSDAAGWKLGPSANMDLSGVTTNGKGGWIAVSSSTGSILERGTATSAWVQTSGGVGYPLRGVASTSTGQIIAVGDYGFVTKRVSASSGWAMGFGEFTNNNLSAVAAISDDDIWVVGDQGIAGHFKNGGWSGIKTPTSSNLRAVWAASSDAVYAVGLQGAMLRWDGTAWKKMLSPSVKNWYGVWGMGPNDVFAIGEGGQIAHWDGQNTQTWAWSLLGSKVEGSLRAVWGLSPDDVWAIGELGIIYHNDGSGWVRTPIPDYKPDEAAKPVKITSTLWAIWGATWDDIWAAGEPDSHGKGVLVHWDGTAWKFDPSFADEGRTVRAMWGWSKDKILIAGTQGMVLRFDGEGGFQDLHPKTIATLFGMTGYGKDALLVGDIGTVLRWTPLD